MKTSTLIFFAAAIPLFAREIPAPGEAAFDALAETILPTEEERQWLRIPWMTDLWKARQKAAEEGKPVFLWEMDGHPMGCT